MLIPWDTGKGWELMGLGNQRKLLWREFLISWIYADSENFLQDAVAKPAGLCVQWGP